MINEYKIEYNEMLNLPIRLKKFLDHLSKWKNITLPYFVCL